MRPTHIHKVYAGIEEKICYFLVVQTSKTISLLYRPKRSEWVTFVVSTSGRLKTKVHCEAVAAAARRLPRDIFSMGLY